MRNFFDDEDSDDPGSNRMFDMGDIFRDDDESLAIEYTTHVNTNRLVLETALRIVERSFFWRFRTANSKMRVLRETYEQVKSLLLMELEEKENESELDLIEQLGEFGTDPDASDEDEEEEEDEGEEEEMEE